MGILEAEEKAQIDQVFQTKGRVDLIHICDDIERVVDHVINIIRTAIIKSDEAITFKK